MTLSVFDAEDGVLLFGSEGALAAFDAGAAPGVVTRPVSPRDVSRVAGHAGSVAGQLMESSGRWVKLTRESADAAATVRQSGGEILSGVLRGDKGQILQHLKFEHLSTGAVLTPAAPAVLGAMATQYALESALDEITAYLEQIDAKLDQLLKQRKTETLGQIGGITLAIDEAATIYAETGKVSSVTWSKVQATSLALKTMQSEAIAQLNVLAESVVAATGDVDKTARVLGEAQEDAQFWLGVMARAIALQDRQYVLELARVADEDVTQLESHREGIRVARAERVRRLVAGLESIAASITSAAALSNGARVTNPVSGPRVVKRANAISESVATFARHADLELREPDAVEATPWTFAARGLIGEASSAVGKAGTGVAQRAQAVGQAVEERRDERVLRRARKIEEKRHGSE